MKKDERAVIPDGPLAKGTPTDAAIKAEFERIENELKNMFSGRGRALGRFIYRQKKKVLG